MDGLINIAPFSQLKTSEWEILAATHEKHHLQDPRSCQKPTWEKNYLLVDEWTIKGRPASTALEGVKSGLQAINGSTV